MITVYAPASIGNVGVGFDVLGAAIAPIDDTLLGDCVSVTAAKKGEKKFSLSITGDFTNKLPKDHEDNIVSKCWKRFCNELKRDVPVAMELKKNMPIGSGLGSSACSIVASLMAMNEFCGQPLDKMALLGLMGELEGEISGSVHYDNVAPCYLGGMQLVLGEEGDISRKIPHLADWRWVIAYPGTTVSTAEARDVLPAQYCRQDCINHGRFLAGFIHACHLQESNLAAKLMCDVIAEPYRTKLLPGFAEVRKTLVEKMGALACGISGSGPTLFAVYNNEEIAQKKAEVVQWLKSNYLQNDEGFIHICRLDNKGAQRLDIG